MGRYSGIPILKSDTGKQYYKSVVYPDIPLSDSDLYFVTTTGDRLDSLANQLYNDSTLYWVILAANPSLPQNSLFPPVGSQIRIPQNIGNFIDNYKTLNN
jgi:phage tail protein X